MKTIIYYSTIIQISVLILTSCTVSQKTVKGNLNGVQYKFSNIEGKLKSEIMIEKVQKPKFSVSIEYFNMSNDSFIIKKSETKENYNQYRYIAITDSIPYFKCRNIDLRPKNKMQRWPEFFPINNPEIELMQEAFSKFPNSSASKVKVFLPYIIGYIRTSIRSPDQY